MQKQLLKEGNVRHLISFLLFPSIAWGMAGPRPAIPVEPTPTTNPSIPAAEPYLERFKELGKIYGADYITENIKFGFRSFFGSTVGMCSMSGSGRNLVQFSTSAWSRGSDTFREMLAFHELGHCMLGRGHKNSNHSDGRKESIMASFMFSQSTYLAHRDEYLKELFTATSRANFQKLADRDIGGCSFGR